ncbi:MAG: zinc-ribbon domain-containing protein, partial [Myxococcales bacterium]|nr:zinc-ribbon domain-containing protein [Myxococcales bacterium]
MKFTCDSCGAQYLIADEKIGPRGVKVRCKKCSHVIILRPDVLAARDPMEGVTERPSNGHKPQTGGSASSVPVAPSVAAASRGGLAEDVLAAATSSDMGLSQEFRALGFDDGERAKPRAATLSVGLDLSHAAGVSGETSPFAVERTGGSLDLVPPEPGPSDRTAVDSLMVHPFGDERTELLNEAKTDDSALPTGDLNWGAGLGTSALADDGEEPSTRVENLEGLARASTELEDEQDDVDQEDEDTQAGESPLGSFDLAPSVDVSTAPLPQVRDEDDAAGDDDALDELAAMRASLDADMAGISADMSAFDGADDGPQTVVAPHPEEEAGLARSLADLSPGEAVAAAEAAHPFTTAPDQPLGASMPELGIPPGEEDSIAEEIGSAFAAMFGGEGGEEQDPLSALTSALADDDSVNKAETRVFDTEAMAKVEAEQDRALGVDAGEAPEPKEWYVAIDEEQVGPLTRAEVAEHVEAGRLEPGSLCWRAGMGDWSALRSVAPLADLVAAPVAAPVAALAEDEDDAVTVGGAPSPSSSEL